jgi:hypothetical protein
MRAQVNGIENEVARLKDLLKVQYQEIAAQDLEIVEGLKQRKALWLKHLNPRRH